MYVSRESCAWTGPGAADRELTRTSRCAISDSIENSCSRPRSPGQRSTVTESDSRRAFGSDRVVFGTNWPVDRMFSSYPDIVNAYAAIISGFTKAEQTAMFSGNAERLFRI